MKTIKRLNLASWMNSDRRGFQNCVEGNYEIIKTIIGKPGRYFQNGVEWFEMKNGVAYRAKTDEGFQYSLDLLNVQNINSQQIAALRAVVKQKVCSESQRKTVRLYDDFLQIRSVGRNARINGMKSLMRLRKAMGKV